MTRMTFRICSFYPGQKLKIALNPPLPDVETAPFQQKVQDASYLLYTWRGFHQIWSTQLLKASLVEIAILIVLPSLFGLFLSGMSNLCTYFKLT